MRIYARSRSLKSTDPGPAYLNDDNIIGLSSVTATQRAPENAKMVRHGRSRSLNVIKIGTDHGRRFRRSGGGHVSPIIGVGDVNGIVPPPKVCGICKHVE